MYSYEIINKSYLMNKNNEDINDIFSVWNTRTKLYNVNPDQQYFRIEKESLTDIPDDPMINTF